MDWNAAVCHVKMNKFIVADRRWNWEHEGLTCRPAEHPLEGTLIKEHNQEAQQPTFEVSLDSTLQQILD